MKFLILFVSIFMIASCGKVPVRSYIESYVDASTICMRGVEYYYSDRRLAPAFKPDGSLYLCENNYEQ